MRLSRIPQQVSNSLAPLKSSFTCAQGQHFRVFCWLLVTMIVIEGGATLKNLSRLMPRSLTYWTVLRMMRSRLWDPKDLILELSEMVLYTLPPPAGGLIHVVGDLTTNQRTGKKQPLARKMRTNQYGPYLFGQAMVILSVQWESFRVPVAAAVVNPKIKGHQNILFRQMLEDFVPPSWAQEVIVEADAGFAAKQTLRLINERPWGYVFGLARTWKLEDDTYLINIAHYTTKACYHRYASHKPDGRRKDYWVYRRTAEVRHLGHVTILFSKRRLNDGPKRIKLFVTNLSEATTGEILSYYHSRWGIEVMFKELKSGLHLGQMQLTSKEDRVERGLLLPILAYLLLLRLYGSELTLEKGASIWQLKRRFVDELYQEHIDRSEQRWHKKFDQYKAAA